MKAPFTWIGGKSMVAKYVWSRLGDVDGYYEPFGGSCAVLLARPKIHVFRNENANDKNGYIVNFWRAIANNPEEVTKHAANNPLFELELTSRHLFLAKQSKGLAEKLKADSYYYDAKLAGWWVWGNAAWIGPHFGNESRSFCKPHKRPQGVLAINIREDIEEYFLLLQKRLYRVRVLCGDWTRILKEVDRADGIVGVFLDPPYGKEVRTTNDNLYTKDDVENEKVRDWAVEHGKDKSRRIALCGHAEEYVMPDDWTVYNWIAGSGYSSFAKREDCQGKENRKKETIWFSPGCNTLKQQGLFG